MATPQETISRTGVFHPEIFHNQKLFPPLDGFAYQDQPVQLVTALLQANEVETLGLSTDFSTRTSSGRENYAVLICGHKIVTVIPIEHFVAQLDEHDQLDWRTHKLTMVANYLLTNKIISAQPEQQDVVLMESNTGEIQ